jgi:hypothetical protein
MIGNRIQQAAVILVSVKVSIRPFVPLLSPASPLNSNPPTLMDVLRLSRSRESRLLVDRCSGELPFSMWDGMAEALGPRIPLEFESPNTETKTETEGDNETGATPAQSVSSIHTALAPRCELARKHWIQTERGWLQSHYRPRSRQYQY